MAHVWTIPCRTDNFVYVVGVAGNSQVAVVDPCDAPPVLDLLEREGLHPVAILNTHHHGDHVGGNLELLQRYPGLEIYAHSSDQGRIPGQTHSLEDEQVITVAGLRFRVLFVPGHTRGHIAYIGDEVGFVGDTLFGAGCGRLFEGTAAQMNYSLNVKVASVSDTLPLYFAHEYTASNLRFASHVEPVNLDTQERSARTAALRAKGEFTTPTTLAVERRTNPFLRVHTDDVRRAVGAPESAPTDEVFRLLRLAKDQFR